MAVTSFKALDPQTLSLANYIAALKLALNRLTPAAERAWFVEKFTFSDGVKGPLLLFGDVQAPRLDALRTKVVGTVARSATAPTVLALTMKNGAAAVRVLNPMLRTAQITGFTFAEAADAAPAAASTAPAAATPTSPPGGSAAQPGAPEPEPDGAASSEGGRSAPARALLGANQADYVRRHEKVVAEVVVVDDLLEDFRTSHPNPDALAAFDARIERIHEALTGAEGAAAAGRVEQAYRVLDGAKKAARALRAEVEAAVAAHARRPRFLVLFEHPDILPRLGFDVHLAARIKKLPLVVHIVDPKILSTLPTDPQEQVTVLTRVVDAASFSGIVDELSAAAARLNQENAAHLMGMTDTFPDDVQAALDNAIEHALDRASAAIATHLKVEARARSYEVKMALKVAGATAGVGLGAAGVALGAPTVAGAVLGVIQLVKSALALLDQCRALALDAESTARQLVASLDHVETSRQKIAPKLGALLTVLKSSTGVPDNLATGLAPVLSTVKTCRDLLELLDGKTARLDRSWQRAMARVQESLDEANELERKAKEAAAGLDAGGAARASTSIAQAQRKLHSLLESTAALGERVTAMNSAVGSSAARMDTLLTPGARDAEKLAAWLSAFVNGALSASSLGVGVGEYFIEHAVPDVCVASAGAAVDALNTAKETWDSLG